MYASHYVLSTLFPQRQTDFYDPLIARHIGAITFASGVRRESEIVGVRAARAVLDTR